MPRRRSDGETSGRRPNNRRTLERRFLVASLAAAPLAAAAPRASAQQDTPLRPTPAQTLGPFYPRTPAERPTQTDADLLVVEGDQVRSQGVPLYLTGRVLTREGKPVREATVEIWQCDANSVYHHPAGGAEHERDPHFQGYGQSRTDDNGVFHFRTIKPVPYPGRTPHIHVRVYGEGLRTLSTQLYLPDAPENARDFLYRSLSPDERDALALRLEPTPTMRVPHALARATAFTSRIDLVLA